MDWNIEISGVYIILTPSGRLPTNRQWTVTMDAGISGYGEGGSGVLLEEDYTFWFTSAYCPLFTTVGRVRLQMGPIGDNLLDDTIYRLINKNSMDAVEIVRTLTGKNIAYDYWGCTWQKVPPVVKMYVECKTAYDLLAIIELDSNRVGGSRSQLKTLGDMTIRYGGPSAANQSIDPGKKKQLYDCWMEMLNGIKSVGLTYAVRGWYDSTKGYSHPVYEPEHNRVIRPVDFSVSDPHGPWVKARDWQGFFDARRYYRRHRGLF